MTNSKTEPNSIQRSTPVASAKAEAIRLPSKCAECGKPYEARNEGTFTKWLAVYCATCREKKLSEAKRSESAVIKERERREMERIEQRILDRRIADINGSEAWERYRFEHYDPELNKTHAWFSVAKRFPVVAKNLFVYGPTGTGKTHLPTAIARTMWEKDGSVLCRTALQLMEMVMWPEGQRSNLFRASKILDQIADIDALFVDEIDKMPGKKEYRNLFHELIDRRAAKRKYGLLIASNVDLESIAKKYGMPIADRINDERTFEVHRIPPETRSARSLARA